MPKERERHFAERRLNNVKPRAPGKLCFFNAYCCPFLRIWFMKKWILILMISAMGPVAGTSGELVESGAQLRPDFEKDIRPIFETKCFACHSAGTHTSGLVLETVETILQGGSLNGPAVISGKSSDSPLMRYLRGEKKPAMPIGKSPLTADQISLIGRWIDQTKAAAPKGESAGHKKVSWPFTPLKEPAVPTVLEKKWLKTPIDAFLLSKLEKKGVQPASTTDRPVLLRRLYFDLIGLAPTPGEMARFLDDSTPDAYENEIEKLLADPRYGEHWGRHWLDVVRYADTDGGYDEPLPHMWRYRDYVIRAFNQDRPYDRFVREQIAGDSYPAFGEEGKIGLGFLHAMAFSEDGTRREMLTDVVDTTASVFLGLTLGCARCHDHKYDPLPTRDHYRMEGFFAPVTFRTLELPFGQYELPNQQPDVWKKKEKAWEDLLRGRKEFRDKVGSQMKQRLEEARFLQAFQDLKELPPVSDNVVNGDLKRAAREGILLNEEEQKLYTLIVRQLSSYRNPHTPNLYKPMAYSASASLGLNYAAMGRDAGGLPAAPTTFVLKGGDPKHRGEIVEPGFLSVVTGNSEPANLYEMAYDGVLRPMRNPTKALAEWIASPENPLTARVMVNRIWQHHFGQGLVQTPNDFGKNGSGTLHADLIDWLACRFIESGWSVKAMHRLILQSGVYRQRTTHPDFERCQTVDPENQYFWRWNPLRLEAEVIRDSILSVSGELNPLMGGPGFLPEVDQEMLTGADVWFEPAPPEERNRRTIYMWQQRSLVFPFVKVFDGANMNESCPARGVTTGTPQVFALFNSKFVHEQSRKLGERIIREVGSSPTKQVERAFNLALTRDPTASERTDGIAFLSSGEPLLTPEVTLLPKSEVEGGGTPESALSGVAGAATPRGALSDLCLALFNLSEFVYSE
ncbi:MAG: DUF1553 domain-containing protein [Acidobacteria bacterium]|nr:DUF1553 domain-containing protein [Acidobacteriota bacterium]